MSVRMPDPVEGTRQYRRGAVMGLTVAEAFMLLAFVLMMLMMLWRQEDKKELKRRRSSPPCRRRSGRRCSPRCGPWARPGSIRAIRSSRRSSKASWRWPRPRSRMTCWRRWRGPPTASGANSRISSAAAKSQSPGRERGRAGRRAVAGGGRRPHRGGRHAARGAWAGGRAPWRRDRGGRGAGLSRRRPLRGRPGEHHPGARGVPRLGLPALVQDAGEVGRRDLGPQDQGTPPRSGSARARRRPISTTSPCRRRGRMRCSPPASGSSRGRKAPGRGRWRRRWAIPRPTRSWPTARKTRRSRGAWSSASASATRRPSKGSRAR